MFQRLHVGDIRKRLLFDVADKASIDFRDLAVGPIIDRPNADRRRLDPGVVHDLMHVLRQLVDGQPGPAIFLALRQIGVGPLVFAARVELQVALRRIAVLAIGVHVLLEKLAGVANRIVIARHHDIQSPRWRGTL